MSLSQIKSFIEAHDNFAIIGHANPDGDCIGSCLGLWHILKSLGKSASVCIKSEDVPRNLKFIWDESAQAEDGQAFTAYIAVDCAGIDRLSCRSDEFAACENTACIDHHRTNEGFASHNAVIPDAAAAGEIMYYLASEVMGINPSGAMAEAIYTAIIADTGGFKYSSTTSRTMRAGAALLDAGVDSPRVYKELFDTYTEKQMSVVGDIASTLTMHSGGRVASIYVSEKFLESKGMKLSDVDFMTNMPRTITGVDVGIYIKERADEVKISLRSGENVDVSQIAASLGGGGHMRASGITLHCTPEEALESVLAEINKVL